jgi:hypothetical protein
MRRAGECQFEPNHAPQRDKEHGNLHYEDPGIFKLAPRTLTGRGERERALRNSNQGFGSCWKPAQLLRWMAFP